MSDESSKHGASNGEARADLQFGYWAVCFVDVVGMKEALLRTDVSPSVQGAERDALIAALKDSVGAIRMLHDVARGLVTREGLGSDSAAPERPECRVSVLTWSDSVIMYAPLAPSSDHHPGLAVAHLLQICAFLQLAMLASGKPIRGGIDVGSGLEIDGQLMGAALVKAYKLESASDGAGYPRVLVGNGLHAYLVSSGLAPVLRAWLGEDTDGRRIVHFLGDGNRGFLSRGPDAKWVSEARAFCVRERERLLRERSELVPDSEPLRRNDKLFGYYSSLLRYVEQHAEAWKK